MHVECYELSGKNINIKIDIKNSIINLDRLYNYNKRIICSYRIKRAMTIKNLQKNENLIYKGLICAVNMHRKAMQLVFV